MTTNKTVYFIVGITSEGKIEVDDHRAEAVFDGDDIWDNNTGSWNDVDSDRPLFNLAKEALEKIAQIVNNAKEKQND